GGCRPASGLQWPLALSVVPSLAGTGNHRRSPDTTAGETRGLSVRPLMWNDLGTGQSTRVVPALDKFM
ncbi:MAG: hypothetical protein ACJ73N_16785, partial [Bryobacteraceae bacterium]